MKKAILPVLLLLSALTACAGSNTQSLHTPVPVPSAEVTSSVSEDVSQTEAPLSRQEIDEECIGLVRQYLTDNKERMWLYDVLSGDTEHLFADYTGGPSEVVHYSPLGYHFISGTSNTDDVYYWFDESGEASPQQAAQELITVMLEDIKALPEDERSFTLLEYLVKKQTLYTWEDLPSFFYETIDTDGMTLEQAVDKVTDQLEYDARSYYHPFDWYRFGYALGPDMWALDPCLTFDYEGNANMYWREEAEGWDLITDDGLVIEVQQGSAAIFDYIIVRRENVWRMQRAGAMESMLSD